MYLTGTHPIDPVVGVDWLTVTFGKEFIEGDPDEYSRAVLKMLWVQATDGVVSQPERDERMGYRGWRRPGLYVGTRYDGLMVQASGAMANEVVDLIDRNGRCTRVDLAVTANFPDDGRILRSLYPAIQLTNGAKGVVYVEPKLTMDEKGGDKLTMGSRESERYIRFYDKTREAKDERYAEGNWYRFELELKDRLADMAFDMLTNGRDKYITASTLMQQEFQRRGVPVRFTTTYNSPALRLLREDIERDENARLRWLAKQVRPTVRKLIRQGITQHEIAETLGLWDNVDSAEEQSN